MPKDFESDTYDDDCEKNSLPVILFDLLSQSCLVPAMSSYLRNDSGKNLQKYVKQECIPVGCVPPADCPYLVVSAGGFTCPVDVYLPGGYCLLIVCIS